MIFHFIHNKALIRCIHNCKDCRTIPEETADSLLNMFRTKENSFPFELMEAEFLNDEYRSEIIKKAKEVFEDARDFQYVRLGFEDSNYGSKEQVCYNWEIIKEFKEVFAGNIAYPALFGKTKIKNENLVMAVLEQTQQQISDKAEELASYAQINV